MQRELDDLPKMSPPETHDAFILGSNLGALSASTRLQTRYIQAASVLTISVALVALSVLISSAVYVNTPGPNTIYSHFAALVMSVCLIFQCCQVLLLCRQCMLKTSRFKYIFRWIYWTVLVISTFIAGVAWALSGKQDAAAVQFLAFFNGLTSFTIIFWKSPWHSEQLNPASSKWYLKTARGINRFLKVLHAILSILFAAGAITLALQFRYQNFGERYNVPFDDGRSIVLNVYCTGPPSASTPTLWFESTQAHGTTDFLGVQSYLWINHGRLSCSYDHVNQGWSGAASKDFTNSSMYWSSLLNILGRQNEPYIGIGWGGGGEDVLSHALESPSTTKGVVFLDTSPDGIEWMDAARIHSWNEAQLLDFRQQDLSSRISLVQVILALAIPWGIMPAFLPQNSTEYFDETLYARHRAQSAKDDLWAFQYYALINMRAQSNVSTYLTDTVLPSTIPVYTIMTNNSNTASDVYQRGLKVDMMEHIAGGKDNVKGWGWCTDSDCGQGFPVTKARWTADALMALGI